MHRASISSQNESEFSFFWKSYTNTKLHLTGAQWQYYYYKLREVSINAWSNVLVWEPSEADSERRIWASSLFGERFQWTTAREWGEKTGKRRGPVPGMWASRSPPRVAGPQSQGELGRGINYASDMPHLRDERGGIFIHQTEYICLSTWLCLVLLVARGIPGCSTWDLVPCLGIEPGPQAMGSWVLATGWPGKSPSKSCYVSWGHS